MDAFFANPRRGKKRPSKRGGRRSPWRLTRGNIVKDRNVFFLNGIWDEATKHFGTTA